MSPARSASLLDIFACVTQSVLRYGAHILLAASIARTSPLELVGLRLAARAGYVGVDRLGPAATRAAAGAAAQAG